MGPGRRRGHPRGLGVRRIAPRAPILGVFGVCRGPSGVAAGSQWGLEAGSCGSGGLTRFPALLVAAGGPRFPLKDANCQGTPTQGFFSSSYTFQQQSLQIVTKMCLKPDNSRQISPSPPPPAPNTASQSSWWMPQSLAPKTCLVLYFFFSVKKHLKILQTLRGFSVECCEKGRCSRKTFERKILIALLTVHVPAWSLLSCYEGQKSSRLKKK